MIKVQTFPRVLLLTLSILVSIFVMPALVVHAEDAITKSEINNYIVEVSGAYGIQPEIVMAIVEAESRYIPTVSNGQCIGLMQVSSYWHKNRMAKLGVTNLYDPKSNILVGVDLLSELYTNTGDMIYALLLYSMKASTAAQCYKSGDIPYYASHVMERAGELERQRKKEAEVEGARKLKAYTKYYLYLRESCFPLEKRMASELPMKGALIWN